MADAVVIASQPHRPPNRTYVSRPCVGSHVASLLMKAVLWSNNDGWDSNSISLRSRAA